MNKKVKRIACSAFALVSALSLVGCKKETVPDTPETLQIYVYKAGYGTKWCTDMIELFKQPDWVKEKISQLNYSYAHYQRRRRICGKSSIGRKKG